ncbi:hypothetical protein CGRA01v4_08377 [Colletotrichum graminicola]|uniref:AB hydrolase-1 domain-containing protein n=1 Tax=Colletotrichum graminicola (strain M1.001 / M2 / FGSC 10212) TaxID=645133 RepID=E3QMD7_COLGM|nr:uncharacterized protein GLRG_07169 [Colletotrichum graminicola M1.001]EFQ32025.1 hypothetical protein GLRG_07169 [Colletotrichum graminicola M1.001]WDK17094.1 hypothetical protein CGRA01v4_08377 [Colletotrichum graminicola]
MPFFKHNENISIFYLEEGPQDAPVVFLIPGITCDLHDWNWQVPFLLQHGFRVITPDPRGQGRSSAPPPTPDIKSYPGPNADPSIVDYYPQSAAEDFIALLQYLNISSAIIIAHSLDTAVAYHLVRLVSVRPDLARAMVILDPLHSISTATVDEHLSDPMTVLPNLARLFDADMHPPTVPAWHNSWTRRRAMQTDMGVIMAQCWACLGDPNAIGRREVSVAQHDDKLMCPRLTLGNSDYWVATERTYLKPSSEHDEIILVGGMGHWFFQHKSMEVNEHLERWFKVVGLLPVQTLSQ